MLAQALLSGNSSNSNVILKEYIKTETNPSYLWAMDDSYNNNVLDDSFTGIDDSFPNIDLWSPIYTPNEATNYTGLISGNTLKLTLDPDVQGVSETAVIDAIYDLEGDFRIETNYYTPRPSANALYMEIGITATFPDGSFYSIAASNYTGQADSRQYAIITNGARSRSQRSVNEGILGLERINGELFLLVFDAVIGWRVTPTEITSAEGSTAKISFFINSDDDGAEFYGTFDSYTVISGSPVWPVIEEIVENHGETINAPIAQQPPLTAYSLPTDKSFLINGSTQAIDTNLTVSSQASRTVLMTFEMTDFPEPQQLFSDGDYEALTKRLHLGIDADYWAWIVSDGVDGYGNSDVYPHNLVVGEKYIVAYVIDGHDISIYVNGVLSAGFTIPNDVDPATGVGNLIIGKDGSENIFYGNFYVDLFVVYDEALSLYDIRATSKIFLTGSY